MTQQFKLTYNGVEYPVQAVEFSHTDQGFSYQARGRISRDEMQKSGPLPLKIEVAPTDRLKDLIAFAKTGAPPALEDDPTLKCSCWNCVQRRKKEMKYGTRLDPSEIENALRDREAAFEVSTLPPGTTALPPRELYADRMWPRSLPRMQEQKPWVGDAQMVTMPEGHSVRATPVSAVQAARDEKHPMRGAPRKKAFMKDGCLLCANSVCDECDGRRPESLNGFTAAVHQANQHWWHDPSTGEKLDRNMGEMLMLVVSEIAECMEGERKDLMDDHLPHRKMAEVELADAIIRLADIIGSRGTDIDFAASIRSVEGTERTHIPHNKGEALLHIIRPLQEIREYRGYTFRRKLARTWHRIESYAAKHNYDLWGAVAEKREYNRHRADHKPAARLAAGGKKF